MGFGLVKAAFYLWAGRGPFFINTAILGLDQAPGTLELTALGLPEPLFGLARFEPANTLVCGRGVDNFAFLGPFWAVSWNLGLFRLISAFSGGGDIAPTEIFSIAEDY